MFVLLGTTNINMCAAAPIKWHQTVKVLNQAFEEYKIKRWNDWPNERFQRYFWGGGVSFFEFTWNQPAARRPILPPGYRDYNVRQEIIDLPEGQPRLSVTSGGFGPSRHRRRTPTCKANRSSEAVSSACLWLPMGFQPMFTRQTQSSERVLERQDLRVMWLWEGSRYH